MGYLYLFIGLICAVIKGYCGKRMSGKTRNLKEIMTVNAVRMFMCVLIGFVVVFMVDGAASFRVKTDEVLISLLCGAANVVFVVSWIISVQNGAYMLTSVFGMLGLIVPIVMSSLFFDEQVKLTQYFGFAMQVVAVMVMCSYNNNIKKKLNFKTFGMLLLSGISNGVMSFAQKMYVRYAADGSILAFNFYTYVFSAVILGICCLVLKNNKNNDDRESLRLKSVYVYIIIMSVCLFMNSCFLTLAAGYLDAVQLYPLNTGVGLVLSSAMAAVFFKEKLTLKGLIGIILTFVALLIINLL